jgi:hypothetical protein
MRQFFASLLLFMQACGELGAPAPTEPGGLPGPLPGWGAVFWRNGTGYLVGPANARLVGPRGIAEATFAEKGPCEGLKVVGGPEHGVLSLPNGLVPTSSPQKPPTNPAGLVEAAAWRIDESLPAPDRFTPNATATDPARQRGVALGSLVKVRRQHAPPILLAAGTRDCTGAFLILDHEGKTVVDRLLLPGTCGMGRVLPPADLDGDGAMETAWFSEDAVLLARLTNGPNPRLEPLGLWRCPQ